jgi:hypothetical protein
MWRAARAIAHCDAGDVIIDRAAFADLPVEIARRLLQEALVWIGGGGVSATVHSAARRAGGA